MKKWWRNRDVILILAVVLGVLAGQISVWSQPLVLPALGLVMTLSTMGVRRDTLKTAGGLWAPVLVGLFLNYVVLSGVLFGLSRVFIQESAIREGFVLMMAVPPAIAVIPFTDFLEGNLGFSLLASVGCYLGALALTPLIALTLIGATSIEPTSVLLVIGLLIALPLILSRVLLWTGVAPRLEPWKGTITNWSFFVVMYTIVGLNRELFLHRPLTLVPVVAIALVTTFGLGELIEWLGRALRIDRPTLTSLVLLGTLKNYGIAGGLALALFSRKTAMPAAVASVFMVVYIIWLDFKKRRLTRNDS
jgi:BASS family bile acid:Na+ symporter